MACGLSRDQAATFRRIMLDFDLYRNPNPQPEVHPVHIILKGGESVVIQRPGHKAVVEVYTTGVHSASGLTVGRRNARTADERHTAGVGDEDPAFVRINIDGNTYCYRNVDGAVMGDHVLVRLPSGQPLLKKVIGLGRGAYTGPVYKSATLANAPAS